MWKYKKDMKLPITLETELEKFYTEAFLKGKEEGKKLYTDDAVQKITK